MWNNTIEDDAKSIDVEMSLLEMLRKMFSTLLSKQI